MAAPKIFDSWSSQGTVPEVDRGHDIYAGGVLVGTPEYMSPEQARSSGEDIDTVSVCSIRCSRRAPSSLLNLHVDNRFR